MKGNVGLNRNTEKKSPWRTVQSTQDSGCALLSMDMGSRFGLTELSMKGIGSIAELWAGALFGTLMVIHTKESGKMTKLMGMGSTHTETARVTVAFGLMISDMD